MRIFRLPTVPGWIVFILGGLWNLLGAWERIEFLFKKLWPEKDVIPMLSAIASFPWFPFALMAVGLGWILFFSRRPAIEIQSLWNGKRVRLKETVHGRIRIPDSPVQVWVKGGDYWYLQSGAIVSGNSWEADCQFGRKESASGSSYNIVAILTAESSQNIRPDLPPGPKSKEIRVFRL